MHSILRVLFSIRSQRTIPWELRWFKSQTTIVGGALIEFDGLEVTRGPLSFDANRCYVDGVNPNLVLTLRKWWLSTSLCNPLIQINWIVCLTLLLTSSVCINKWMWQIGIMGFERKKWMINNFIEETFSSLTEFVTTAKFHLVHGKVGKRGSTHLSPVLLLYRTVKL